MTEIIKDLYQFTEVMEPIKLSMHQYLLMTNEPVLIQTGAVSQAQTTIPKLQELLGERKIKYILISHFESDECGGLALVLKEHPEAVAVCSETTARQLMGFGITNNVLIRGCKPEPPKFPSRQFHPSHKGIQINHLAVTLKGVMPVQQNVSPGYRRYLGEYR